jgi:hypothetical protein
MKHIFKVCASALLLCSILASCSAKKDTVSTAQAKEPTTPAVTATQEQPATVDQAPTADKKAPKTENKAPKTAKKKKNKK